MIYVLMVFLICIFLMAFMLSGGELLSPWVITTGMFILSSFVIVLNSYKWGTDYDVFAIILICSGLLFFGFGEITSRLIVQQRFLNSPQRSTEKHRIIVPVHQLLFVILVMSIILFIDLRATMRAGNSIGSISDITSFLSNSRSALSGDGFSKGIASRLVVFNKALGYIFTYICFYNLILFKSRYRLSLYIIPVLIFMGNALISTGRTEFLSFIIYLIMLILILLKSSNRWSVRGTLKVLKIVFFGILLFFILFTFVGRLGGKGIYNSPLDYIYYYTGSSLYLFNSFVGNYDGSLHEFGSTTLYGLFNLLNVLGFDIPVGEVALEMSYIPHFYSNIYTAYRRYIQDYGIIGLLIIQYFLGLLYGGIFEKIRKFNLSNFTVILYCAQFFPIIEMVIEERFMVKILTSTNFLFLLLLYLSYRLLVNSNFEVLEDEK
ncbi:O-antigen polymerase [Enterococcus casseliflavus]|uniref:O-antigen polymerase n=1 Tax=Enterococcus casseliflavus TaxID=37734 RepID=UPI00188380B5|nr:O-antigen polymerase [Enterococcus casseliflavus]MBE9900344.1 oligosaccharide repeat unit polymerase [Enterococcus casseliflavus]MBE9903629.1 oligosaccharide repeat unit polymerase [Enterococcus casseliflavus]MBE9923997.1 oligosaccharide repeat unit polymerase [Enterococcus casseliflavus]